MVALPEVLDASTLRLVRGRAAHVEELLDAVRSSLPELRMWMPWAQTMPTRVEQRAFLDHSHAAFDAGTDFVYLFYETTTNSLVGGGGVHRRIGPRAVEIGYWVRTDRYERGYATTAARAMTDASFAFLDDVDRVEIHMDVSNVASARIPEKLGYRRIRTEPREKLAAGHTGDGWVWATTRDEWTETWSP